jgi:glucose-1-phosphate adenylyltransferase
MGKIVILAGGISSRMRKPLPPGVNLPLELEKDANEKAKSMIGLGKHSRPFLDYVLYEVKKAGYQEVIIVIGERDVSIKKYYGEKERENEFLGLKISYALQKIPPGRTKPLGTADALLCALTQYPEWHGSKFTVINSDNLYSAKALRALLETKAENALIDYARDSLKFPLERLTQFAVTIKNREGYLIDIIEKPTLQEIEYAKGQDGVLRVSMNIWCNQYDLILPFLKSVKEHPIRQEKELPTAELNMSYQSIFRISLRDFLTKNLFLRRFVRFLVKREPKYLIKCIPWQEHVPDLTTKADILPTKEFLAEKYAEEAL